MRAARWFNWVSFWGMALVFLTGCGDEASTPPPSDVSEQDGLDAELELDQVPDLPELSEQSDGEQDDEPDCVSRCEQAVAFNCVEQTLLSTECAVGCVLLDNHAWCSCELDGDCPEEHACALGELGGTCRPLLCTPNAARCEPVDGQGFDAVRCDEQGLSELRERCDGGCVDGVCICLDDSHCLAAQHCDDTGACVEDLCVAQTPFCAGSELRLCDERGVASSLLQECGSAGCLFDACGCETDADCLAAQHCSSEGQPLCVADVCEAGARFCDGDAIMLCSPSGSHAELLQSCARACVAEGDSAYCHCSQASDCLGEAFCDAQGHCIAQVCDPDLLVCDGNVAVSCLPDGSAERRVDCGAQTCLQGVCQCTDDTHCAAAEYCSEGQCLPDVCAQGEEFCAGRERRACAANGSGDSVLENCRIGCVLESGQSACRCNSISDCELEQYCKSPGLGGFDNCSPDICLAGATSCDGQVAVSCSFDGGQETRVDCLAMSCEEGQCRCDADGQCPAEQYCAASRSCTDDVCVASTTFCMGDSVMLCNERGSGSSEAQPCAPGHCAAGACTCSDALECLGAESCMGGACVCESGLRCGPSSTCCSSAEVCEDEQCKLACSGQRCGVSEELCCTGNDECLWNQCIATWGACTVNDDCELDEFCELSSRRCVKAADDPNQCIYIPPVGVFTPEEQWYWTSSSQFPTYRQVMMTPIVLNLTDDNGDGQIDEEDVPDVVFGCFAGSGYNNAGAIRVVSGDDGRELAASMEQPFSVRSDIGAADLDGDGYAEIVVSSANTANPKKLYFLNLLPDGGTGYTLQVKKTLTMDAKFNGAAGITTAAFADLDGDGSIEVVTQYGVTDGATLTHRCDAPSSWSFPVVADLDEDGSMEIIANGSIYDNNCQPLVGGASGYAAVADLVADAGADDLVPEIVWVRGGYTGNIALFNVSKDPGSGAWSMNLVWQTPIPLNAQRILQVYGITCPQTHSACNTGGGPPTIADFDGDGQPEISTAGRWYYIVLETDGSILWADGATRDYSSAATGSSVFDFEGDGAAEVVYNDEITLRVYKGAGSGVDNDGDGFADPEVLFSTANGSGTLFEYPLIVDVDNDGNAEIVVAANNYAYGTHTGIRVFRDPLDNWVRTRRIWNQHTYHVTNINEDGSVPTPESFNWRRASLNNFRQNVQPGGLFNAPNLTISTLSSSNAGCPATVHLHATVENTGSLGVGAGVWVGFYAVDLPGSDSRALLARVQLPNALPPGSAQVLTFVWDYSATLLPSMTPTNLVLPQHLKAVVDDPPASLPNGETNECHEDDNESPVLDLRICQ